MNTYAILKNKKVVPVPFDEWCVWFEEKERLAGHVSKRTVAATLFERNIEISTVFLGLNHGFGRFGDIWFETMIFRGPYGGFQERYSTYEEAEEGHKRAVKLMSGELKILSDYLKSRDEK